MFIVVIVLLHTKIITLNPFITVLIDFNLEVLLTFPFKISILEFITGFSRKCNFYKGN